jgi:amino acid transporter
MPLRDLIFGKPLATADSKKEELTFWTSLPVLGLDSLASTGYGPEAALTILTALGVTGLRYFPKIAILIALLLVNLYFSYRQTAEAYPGGGGAYNVTKDNFGAKVAVWAAVSLLLDYLLNVAVAISAGIGVVISVFPALHTHTLLLCLLVLFTLMMINLRGVRESGLIFSAPVFAFVGCLAVALAIGLFRTLHSGGHPHAVFPPPAIPAPAAGASGWLLLTAFANGCTAMTGIEAVSNAVPLFRKPKVPNAHKTLTAIILTLISFLLALGYLCPAYHIGAMNELQPGYQNVLSQVVAAVAGRGAFYYVSLASIFFVLTYSAQTSFADFPRVCRFLAEDGFLPTAFTTRGRRLVFSHGIVVLAILSAVLLIVFGGITDRLIPLFAIGAFGAFLFSQAGMVRHWSRKCGRRFRIKLFWNALGALTTAIVLGIIVVAKFVDGAWITLIAAPGLVFLLTSINRHYRRIGRQVGKPGDLSTAKSGPPIVIVPISGWNRLAEKAIRLGLTMSDDVTAIHVATEGDKLGDLKTFWRDNVEAPASAAKKPVPRLEILDSPYRRVLEPVVEYVNRVARLEKHRMVAVIIPELIEPHWYEYLLHHFYAARLRSRLFVDGEDRVIVITTPWRLREK